MARKKNKIEILDDILSLENSKKFDYWGWDCYWYDDYPSNYIYDDCDYFNYEYLEDVEFDFLSRRRGRIKVRFGSYIDMNSIYSKTVMRQKKIDYLLGLSQYNIEGVFLGDFFPENFKLKK